MRFYLALTLTHLDANEILGFEVIGRAATPIHNVLVLAFTAQFTIPVGHAEVVVHQAVAHVTVSQHGVEERLDKRAERQTWSYNRTVTCAFYFENILA